MTCSSAARGSFTARSSSAARAAPGSTRSATRPQDRAQTDFGPGTRVDPQAGESIWKKIGRAILGSIKESLVPALSNRDISLNLAVSPIAAESGQEISFSYRRGEREEPVRVKLPRGIQERHKAEAQGNGGGRPLRGAAGGFVPGNQHQVGFPVLCNPVFFVLVSTR